MGLTLLFISLVYCVAYMFLNFFSFYQVVRPLGRKSVNTYLYLCLYLYLYSVVSSACARVTFSKVFWYLEDDGALLDGRRSRSLMPGVDELSEQLRPLSLTAVTDDLLTDSHVARSACFRLLFGEDVHQYPDVADVLWTAVRPRLDDDNANASVVIAYNEQYIEPSEYVLISIPTSDEQ